MHFLFSALLVFWSGVLILKPISLYAQDFSDFLNGEETEFQEDFDEDTFDSSNVGDKSFVQGIKKAVIEKTVVNSQIVPQKVVNVTTNYLVDKFKKRKNVTISELEKWIFNGNNVNQCLTGGNTIFTYLVRSAKDKKAVELFLSQGANLQTPCSPSLSALFEAVKYNQNLSITDLLINADANIMHKDNDGNGVLLLASIYNPNPQIIDLLIDYGANVNEKNKFGYSPLMMAVANNSIMMVKKIIDNGGDINAKDNLGRTALMVSALRGNDEIIQYLIKNGADYSVIDNNGLGVLDYYHKRVYLKNSDFKYNKYASIAEQLFQKFSFITENHIKFNNQLKNSVKNKNDEMVIKNAIKMHADIDVLDENGCSPLLNAAQNNLEVEVFNDLLVSGANPNLVCLGDKSALMFLAVNSNGDDVYQQLKKIKLLYEHKIDPNLVDNEGNSALVYAMDFNANGDFVKGLIDIGANPNILNKNGENVIWDAVRNGASADVVKVLIDGKADLNTKNSEGKSLIWYVLKNDVNEDVVIELINGGLNLEEVNDDGLTPLWYAFYNNVNLPIQLALIENETEIDNINKNEDTYLLYAIKNNYPATIIKALLGRGANPYIVDKNGNNSIDIIKRSQYFEETMKRKTKEHVLEEWEL